MVRCATWGQHEWRGPRLLDAGTDVVRGPYQRYVVKCYNCDVETVETRWPGRERRSANVGDESTA